MAEKKRGEGTPKHVETLIHEEASRRNIPTAEFQSVMPEEKQRPVPVRYPRGSNGLEEEKASRDRDLDPQFVWRGKDERDWSDLVVNAPPLYIQEKVHPKALIDDLLRRTATGQEEAEDQFALFADFNGVPEGDAKTEFYQHDANWTNRMILGDSLQVMASLAEREGLRGQVQCIYIDPPYGIKFNSNFQWSTTSRTVTDGKSDHITREPEQVKAFRDTWRDGIHSYLTYLRDRFMVARDLLSESGSIFVQIGDENVHRVRGVMDEVFGEENLVSELIFSKTVGQTADFIPGISDYCLWYARRREALKYRPLLKLKELGGEGTTGYRFAEIGPFDWRPLTAEEKSGEAAVPSEVRLVAIGDLSSQRQGREGGEGSAMHFPVEVAGKQYFPSGSRGWSTTEVGIARLRSANRIYPSGQKGVGYVRYLDDFSALPLTNIWTDTVGQSQYGGAKVYVVQTGLKVVERCILMSTDPGDLVLDPTCGSGTTSYVAEQWGRRWITIDTSRVALALARARIMGARYPYYMLADSREGQIKEAGVTRTAPSSQPVHGNIRHGFVYERLPHVTLKSIANNAEIDVIWDRFQAKMEPLRASLNAALNKTWQEWEVPREAEDPWDSKTQEIFYRLKSEATQGSGDKPLKPGEWLRAINHNLKRAYTLETLPERPADPWPEAPAKLHLDWWQARIARQKEIDASIAARAEFEYLYDKPYEDKKTVRVAGPFTVESLSPHRVLALDENDEVIDPAEKSAEARDFVSMVLENLKVVQQAHKEDKIAFSSVTPWPGDLVCAEGRYQEGGKEKRAAILVGPEFGTVSRPDLVSAAREAGDAGFDSLIACAFNFDAHSSDFNKLGRIPVLKARMNADLHMADDLKNTGKGNLFVIFGEPDIKILPAENGQVQVKINGVDVFHPNTGEVRSDNADGIACWFIDTDYNEESFFVRHAYFLGANDPYKNLKTTLKAEIDEEAWATLHSDVSRPFDKPTSHRIAVKVINHLGDEVMKVFRVE